MKTLLIFCNLIIACFCSGQPFLATNALPSDAIIRQKMTGTWSLDYGKYGVVSSWPDANSWTNAHIWTINSNGSYLALHTLSSGHEIRTNIYEGTLMVRDGMLIDTIKKCSITNQPVPVVMPPAKIIRVTDQEFVIRPYTHTIDDIFRKVTN